MKWVTARRPHVDRCACAWFIRRFVDPHATFVFLERGAPIPARATPFDLPSVRYGHHGRATSFDAFVARRSRTDPGMKRLADLVRDIDLGTFRRSESRGLDALLYGLLLANDSDRDVLGHAEPVFEGLYRYFRGDGRP